MRTWDEYGRLLVKQDVTSIEYSFQTITGTNFAIFGSVLFVYNSTTGLYHELQASDDQGITNLYLNPTGVVVA